MIGSLILRSAMIASTASTRLTSLTLAAVTTSDNGTPRPSTNRWRFLSFFPRSVGLGPIDALPAPGNAFEVVAFGQAGLPQRLEEARPRPLQKALVHRAGADLRMTVEGMLYRMRVGCPWRDLPHAFGSWSKIYKRFNAWSASGKWLTVLQVLVTDPDMEWVFIDGSYAKAHQHSVGAASGKDEAIGKSRADNTSKVHLAVDTCGLPIAFDITGGQVNDCTQSSSLIAKVPDAESIIADKGYDGEAIREQIVQQGGQVLLPRKRTSVKGNADLDRGFTATGT